MSFNYHMPFKGHARVLSSNVCAMKRYKLSSEFSCIKKPIQTVHGIIWCRVQCERGNTFSRVPLVQTHAAPYASVYFHNRTVLRTI